MGYIMDYKAPLVLTAFTALTDAELRDNGEED